MREVYQAVAIIGTAIIMEFVSRVKNSLGFLWRLYID
jgi:hypothetical protein